jgi:surfeit locus 1 family protein
MDSVHLLDTSTTPSAHQTDGWRALPQQLVSPRWRWITLAALVLTAVFIRLGMWQLGRLQERRAENALVASRITAPPLELTGAPIDIDDLEYRRVTVRGTYDHSQEVVLRNRSRDGVPGVDIITPLRITGSEQSVLVNRGWVPLLQYEQAAIQQFVVPGEVNIEGIVRKTQPRRSTLGAEDKVPADGPLRSWFRVDIDRIMDQVSYPLMPFFVEQLPRQGAPDLPFPQPNTELSEGSHMNYAIQWFSFAIILVCGYAALVATRSHNQPGHQGNATNSSA